MSELKVERSTEREKANSFATLRRAALVAICAMVVAVLGVGVPYKAYKFFKARQHAAAAAVLQEEL